MNDYCKNFKGGYCELTEMHVPRSWCLERCSFNKDQKKLPPLKRMAKTFLDSSYKQLRAGNPQRTDEEIARIKDICMECPHLIKEKMRCSKCGCFVDVKARWQTAHCPEGKWRELTETFLNVNGKILGIEGQYKGAACFLLCNGPSLKDDDHLHHPGIITMGMNNGPAVVRPDLWVSVDNPKKFLLDIWEDPKIVKFKNYAKRGAEYTDGRKIQDLSNMAYFNLSSEFAIDTWFGHRVQWGLPRGEGHCISTFMACLNILYKLGFARVYLIGADFKMDKENPYSFKETKTEGEVLYNNELFSIINEYCKYLGPECKKRGFQIFNSTSGSSLSALPYRPLDEALEAERIVPSAETLGRYSLKHVHENYSKAILYYSHNTIDGTGVNKACRTNLLDSEIPIISVTQKPIDLGKNIVVDLQPMAINIFRQIIEGLRNTDAEFIYLAEHDCLYPPSHFSLTSTQIAYNANIYRLTPYGFVTIPENKFFLSMCMGPRYQLLNAFLKKLKYAEEHGVKLDTGEGLTFFEPGRGTDDAGRKLKVALLKSEIPSIDVRHRKNSSGRGYFKRQPTIQHLDFWGNALDLRKKLGV